MYDWGVTLGSVVLLMLLLLSARLAREHRWARSSTRLLHVDSTGVRRILADGRVEEVAWSEVREIEVVRTQYGPHARSGGVLVLSGDETRGCLIPLDAIEACGVVSHLAKLAGFRPQDLASALAADPPSRRSIWKKASGGESCESSLGR